MQFEILAHGVSPKETIILSMKLNVNILNMNKLSLSPLVFVFSEVGEGTTKAQEYAIFLVVPNFYYCFILFIFYFRKFQINTKAEKII